MSNQIENAEEQKQCDFCGYPATSLTHIRRGNGEGTAREELDLCQVCAMSGLSKVTQNQARKKVIIAKAIGYLVNELFKKLEETHQAIVDQ